MMSVGRIPVLVLVAVALGAACSGNNDGGGDLFGAAGSGGHAGSGLAGSMSGSGGTTSVSGGSGGDTAAGAGGSDPSNGGNGGSGGGGSAGSTRDSGGPATGGSGGAKPPRDAGVETGGSAGTKDAAPPPPSNAQAIPCDLKWPMPTQTQDVPTTIKVTGTYDGAMKRFVGSGALGTATQSESQGPLFDLANGAVLKNVVLGAPAADGVHCDGNCTLQNVWWEDVGEDAATQKGKLSTQVMTIDGGGALHAADKIFQHNGPGTMVIKNFYAKDFGKLYRSCGNCQPTQYTRHVIIQNVTLVAPGLAIAGVNTNYMDTATFDNITICDPAKKISVCNRYTGNDTGAEPPLTGKGADGISCIFSPNDITWQ